MDDKDPQGPGDPSPDPDQDPGQTGDMGMGPDPGPEPGQSEAKTRPPGFKMWSRGRGRSTGGASPPGLRKRSRGRSEVYPPPFPSSSDQNLALSESLPILERAASSGEKSKQRVSTDEKVTVSL